MAVSSRKDPRLSKSKQREIRRRQKYKARKARRLIQYHVACLPTALLAFLQIFSFSFTKPTFFRFVLLLLAAILSCSARSVSFLLRVLGPLAPGSPSAYHRVFSHRIWSSWTLARALLGWILRFLVGPGPVYLAADDTVTEHPGDQVYGKSCHRDAVRSSHSFTAFRWGHKWLVLAVLVRIPLTTRLWALPIFVVLCRSEKDDKKEKRRHKTPAQILAQVLLVLRRWFPDRTFIVAADGGYASHELTKSCSKHQGKIQLVSRFYSDAALYEPPPVAKVNANGKKPSGRPRVKGAKLDSPAVVVAETSQRQRLWVAWYGGGQRHVEVVSGTGHWYKAGQGLVEVRWVFVHDLSGTHRDEYFSSTALTLSAQEIIEAYVARWNLETTFEEMRSGLGLGTTRGRKKETVLREEPCLFGLYSVVVCLYSLMPKGYAKVYVKWAGKEGITFSDALSGVRRWLWVEWVFQVLGQKEAFKNLSKGFQEVLLNGLAPVG